MSYTIIKKLPPVEEIIQAIPLSEAGYQQVMRDRQEIENILAGHDDRLIVIVGPCSAWPKEAVLEYAAKLVQLNEEVKHALKLIMRVYIQKPRTTKGWKGPLNQPDPLGPPDIEAGMRYARDMMVKVVEMGLPISDEALFTHNAKGFLELLSWVAIGARSSEDQEHRVFASSLDCPVGLKNPTHGSIAVGVNSVVAAQFPHVAAIDGYEVETQGNPYAHLVLRGSNHAPNYSITHLEEAQHHMQVHKIKNQAIIIDVSHDNCLINGKKDHHLQPNIISEILNNLKTRPDLKKLVKGFMIESFLQDGNQQVDSAHSDKINREGLSITDPCLGWAQTETALLNLANEIAGCTMK